MIFILCALPQEARPLVKELGLKHTQELAPYAAYQDERIILLITGVGKLRMSCAIGFLAAKFPGEHVWLNIGVAGHRHHDIGCAFHIEKVIDRATKKEFYPSIAFASPFARATIETVDSPDFTYETPHLIDMEASAFFLNASKFSSLELIQSVKVISDNSFEEKIKIVLDIFAPLTELLEKIQIPSSPYLEPALEKWHFTQSEKIRLKRQLDRFHLLFPNESLTLEARSGKDFLAMLTRKCDDFKPLY